jgi:transposase-like protein
VILQQRWPSGFRCGRCGHGRAYPIENRDLFECGSCGYQVSATAGTIFHKSKTDLRKWFLAIYLLASTKKAPSSAELARQLGVTRKTAWLIRHKITPAMRRREGELMLQGLVELDEAYIGGKEKKAIGRGAQKKRLVAISAEETAQGGLAWAHIQLIPDAGQQALSEAASRSIRAGSLVKTDRWRGYSGLDKAGYRHCPQMQGQLDEPAKLLPWVHVIISNFKRWILDIFHGVSPKHLQVYLDEFCYRLNRRYHRLDLFRRILNRCVRYASPVTYAQVTAT